MSATLILKILLTAFLIFANVVWVGFAFMTAAMNRLDGTFTVFDWLFMSVPTGLNILFLWSIWE